MLAILRDGVESNDWRQRQATLLFLSLASTPLDGAKDLHRDLVRGVVSLLLDPIDAVVGSARQALLRLRDSFGEAEFGTIVRALPPALRSAYEGSGSGDTRTAETEVSSIELGFVSSRLLAQLRQKGDWQLRAQARR